MQAVVYRGPRDLRLETLPVPRIGPNELLVKVAVCGVCPTDIKKMHYGTVPPPRVFGHETAGTIVRTGARVRGFAVGDRVALHHHIPCMHCHFCRHQAFAQCLTYKRTGITAGFEPAGGGYAEYVRVLPFVFPGVIKIPARNTFQEGAMLEPVNTVLKGIRRLNLLPGDNVLVVGVGPIGLMFTRLLALEKMRVLASDLFPSRLRLAKKLGAKVLLQANDPKFAEAVRRSTGKQGLDAAIICAPVDAAVQQAQELVNGAGKILLFAHTKRGAKMPIDLAAICADEKDLIGSYSADVTLQKEVARLVFSGRMPVRELITHRFSLAQTAAAVDLAAQPTPDSLKVVVDQTLSGR
ncbi:MAG: Sorbitol dehydrogenase [Verrucomicrobiales bacterium]|nr:Sorbitol dehydrogenase [Verrucomicrobiales bacterium]